MKVTKTQLLREIREHGGILSEIARKYGMTYAAIHKRIKDDAALTEAMQEARESLLDEAQSQLVLAVRAGKPWAVKLTLETWGRSRGFTKQLEVVEPNPEGQVVIYIPDNGRDLSTSLHAS